MTQQPGVPLEPTSPGPAGLEPVTPAVPSPEAGGAPQSPWARPDDTPPIEPPPVALHGWPRHTVPAGAEVPGGEGGPVHDRSVPPQPVASSFGVAGTGQAPPAQVSPPSAAPAGYGPSPAPVPPPPRDGQWSVARVEPVPGTSYGAAHAVVLPATSGPAVGSLVAGIAALGVSLLVACFGLAGAQDGWGLWVAGAFSLLGGLAGLAAVGLGVTGRRQIRSAGDPARIRFTGGGLAVAGIACGGVALGLVVFSLAAVLLVQLG